MSSVLSGLLFSQAIYFFHICSWPLNKKKLKLLLLPINCYSCVESKEVVICKGWSQRYVQEKPRSRQFIDTSTCLISSAVPWTGTEGFPLTSPLVMASYSCKERKLIQTSIWWTSLESTLCHQENVCSLGTGKKEVENFQCVFPFAAVKWPQFKGIKENTNQPDLKSFIPEIHFTGTGADQRGRLQFQTKFVLEVISLKSVLYVFCTILSSILMFSFNLMLL